MKKRTRRRSSDPPVLAAAGLRREYDDLIALARLDLKVLPGELVALVGSNGAGKTTLLAIAAGLVEASHGTIQICGEPAGSLIARARTSYIPDTPVFYQDLSLNEHLEYIARLHEADDWQSRASELLDQLGLEQWGDKLPTQFSRGMRQKASLALGFVRPFSLLLADEPFDGLDPASRAVLVEMLRATADAGAAVIVSTHRTEVADFSSRCIALRDGQLIYDGPPDRAVIAGDLPSGDGAPLTADVPEPEQPTPSPQRGRRKRARRLRSP
jgi:ABC-2 type transport system ATP-binding protein